METVSKTDKHSPNSNKPMFPTTFGQGGAGLTKREVFAMAAMQGLLANGKLWKNLEAVDDSQFHSWFAEQSIMYANELLKELDTK